MRLIIGLLVSVVCLAPLAGRAAPAPFPPHPAPASDDRSQDVVTLRHVHPAAPAVRTYAQLTRALAGTGLPIVLDSSVPQDLFDPGP